MRKQLMTLANALRKTGLSLSAALKRAWAAIRIKTGMLTNPVSFFYRKDDGSERFAVGFYGAAPGPERTTGKPSSPLVIRYYDTLAGGWRSFRVDRLLID